MGPGRKEPEMGGAKVLRKGEVVGRKIRTTHKSKKGREWPGREKDAKGRRESGGGQRKGLFSLFLLQMSLRRPGPSRNGASVYTAPCNCRTCMATEVT